MLPIGVVETAGLRQKRVPVVRTHDLLEVGWAGAQDPVELDAGAGWLARSVVTGRLPLAAVSVRRL